ncbi:MAG: hypothetical protein J0G96_06400 [Flavobacteriia bacterium]|nr:hypothetical protein [Flavobacteriia bacterium]OJX36586.1 MAG: hypothetical protein BGO87_12350 [Flavobacteriia bacterium 40-80]
MLSNITWTEYLTTVGLMMIAYYTYVGLRYYPTELKRLLSMKKENGGFEDAGVNPLIEAEYEDEDEGFQGEDEQDEYSEVEALITSLTELIKKATEKKAVLPEFKQSLRMVLRKYPSVKETPFRSSINELIVSECAKSEYHTLSEGEVNRLWEDSIV